MIVGKPLPFVNDYVNNLNEILSLYPINAAMTYGHQKWLAFCLTCIIVTSSICWRKFNRISLGSFSEALLSWYFRRPMTWELLLKASVNLILTRFEIKEGILLIDDTGKKRSKVTKRIPYTHYFKDKQGTGTIKGQEIVLLVLVTASVTIPVCYEFYQPDPAYTKWAKEDKRLKKQGVPKCKRPPQPPENPKYPTKQEIALKLLKQFADDCPFVKVKVILADTLYGSADFMQKANKVFAKTTQVVSQLRHNQKIWYKDKIWHLDEYFNSFPGTSQTISIRGFSHIEVIVGSARLYVEAQKRKCFVIAVRYPSETDNRYLVATDLTWRTLDIVQAYTYRWLVEVTTPDLKVYEGWGQSTKQPDEEGSRRGLILSLLCDHCLLLHPEQQARVAQRQPLFTIGSLQRRLQMESFTSWLSDWLDDPKFDEKLGQLIEAICPLFPLRSSQKHLSSQQIGRLEPTPGLKYRGLQEIHAIS
jgi:hypothetical protein